MNEQLDELVGLKIGFERERASEREMGFQIALTAKTNQYKLI